MYREDLDTKLGKLNLRPYIRVAHFAMQKWPYILICIFGLLVTAFYDSSLNPMLLNSAIKSLEDALALSTGIDDFIINVNLIFGINFRINLWGFAGILVGSMIFKCFFIFLSFKYMFKLEIHITRSIRYEGFKHIQTLSYSYFDTTPAGWIIARLQSDASTVAEIFAHSAIHFVWIMADIAFIAITMFSVSWQLGLIAFSLSPVIIIVSPLLKRTMLKHFRTARNNYSNFIRWVSECINGIATIKTLSIEEKCFDECAEITENMRVSLRKGYNTRAFFRPTVEIVAGLTNALIVLVAWFTITGGGVSAADEIANLVLFIGFSKTVYMSIATLSEINASFVTAQASAEKLLTLFDTKPAIVDSEEVINKYGSIFAPKSELHTKMNGDIEFKDVDFNYVENINIFRNFNLSIKSHSSMAIVGTTGSGKTTLVNLLCRFYDIQKGLISIDGTSIKDMSVGQLRSNVAYVQQTPVLFSGTYFDNIAYGKPNATKEEVIKAAKIVGIHDLIVNQPDGYETSIKDHGSKLSVGQKQLVSFARAIIRDPQILILDEATSSIDQESETQIQNAIKEILVGRTSIVIAHRLSTIINSDRILLLEKGQIIEDGSHVDLMKKRDKYYELYMSQFETLDLDSQINIYNKELSLN